MKIATVLVAGAVAAATLALPHTASAGLIYDASILALGQGFGTAPRDLTLQRNGVESGSVSVGGQGQLIFGAAVSDGIVFMGNGITNSSLVGDMPQPRVDDNKYGIPTIGSLGITTASQIAILFNATEPGGVGNSVSVTDLTLKFYTFTGGFLGAIDGQQNFASTLPGNGSAGFTFVIDQVQQTYVNGLLANGATTKLALEATIRNAAGGPETFMIYNRAAVPVPEPVSMALLGVGLAGLGFARRHTSKA